MNSRANDPCLHQWTVPLLVEILVCYRIVAKSWSELTYVDIRSRTWMAKWRLQYDSHFVLISICQRHRQMRTKSPLFWFYSGAILDLLVRIEIGIFHCTCDALATRDVELDWSTYAIYSFISIAFSIISLYIDEIPLKSIQRIVQRIKCI